MRSKAGNWFAARCTRVSNSSALTGFFASSTYFAIASRSICCSGVRGCNCNSSSVSSLPKTRWYAMRAAVVVSARGREWLAAGAESTGLVEAITAQMSRQLALPAPLDARAIVEKRATF